MYKKVAYIMTYIHKENPSIKTNQEMAKIMEIAEKEF